MESILKHTIKLGVIRCQNVKLVGLKQKSLDTPRKVESPGHKVSG